MAVLRILSLLMLAVASQRALAWGDDGHKAIALIAEKYLEPAVKTKIEAMLKADPDNLAPHDLPSEATWADKYRDSNGRRDHYEQTQNWHFVDLEINDPDITVACFGRPALPPGTLASNGPPKACVVDKIAQFAAELKDPETDFEERLFALKFLLHFIGDLHQPLHSADNNDRGGNSVKVLADGVSSTARPLHGLWDTQFVDAIARPLLRSSCWRRSRRIRPRVGLPEHRRIGLGKHLRWLRKMRMATRHYQRLDRSMLMPLTSSEQRTTSHCS
jgi:hypothetical protein